MNPHYYIMKCKKILRLEGDVNFSSLPEEIQERALDPVDNPSLDQNQANWRVVIFRDEILDINEFTEWLKSPQALVEEVYEYDLTAN
ncbi:MAG: hypothetical protein ACLGHN_01010 [Bacteriovoracia bacterium]